MRTVLLLALAIVIGAPPALAIADDGWRLRPTSPRIEMGRQGPALTLGLPSGRAWGLESALLPRPAAAMVISADIEIADPLVREAFLRVAWYREATGRPRQIAIADSASVRGTGRVLVTLPLAPPPEAVAYRVRALGRLVPEALRSGPAGLRVSGLAAEQANGPVRPALTRLLTAGR